MHRPKYLAAVLFAASTLALIAVPVASAEQAESGAIIGAKYAPNQRTANVTATVLCREFGCGGIALIVAPKQLKVIKKHGRGRTIKILRSTGCRPSVEPYVDLWNHDPLPEWRENTYYVPSYGEEAPFEFGWRSVYGEEFPQGYHTITARVNCSTARKRPASIWRP